MQFAEAVPSPYSMLFALARIEKSRQEHWIAAAAVADTILEGVVANSTLGCFCFERDASFNRHCATKSAQSSASLTDASISESPTSLFLADRSRRATTDSIATAAAVVAAIALADAESEVEAAGVASVAVTAASVAVAATANVFATSSNSASGATIPP
jgi:hypothetical protein